MIENSNVTSDSLFGFHSEEVSLGIIVPICIVMVTFDLFTITMLLSSEKLRILPNYPIISFMFAAAIQDLFAMPLYLYRYLHTKFVDDHLWVCATYRFAYFYSGHAMKLNLLVVSFDRLYSIKRPMTYNKVINRRNMLVILLSVWIFVAIIDIMPFYMKAETNERCGYVPTYVWSLTVITIFNTIPFFILVCNYYVIWKIAFRKGLHDRRLRDSVNSFTENQLDREKIRSVDKYFHDSNSNESNNSYEMTSLVYRRKQLTKTASKTSAFQFAMELKATRLSLAFMFTYLLCWGPMAIFYLVDNMTRNYLTRSDEKHLMIARFTIKMISFSSSALAPLVYIWRSKSFRQEIQRKCFPKKFRHMRSLSWIKNRSQTST